MPNWRNAADYQFSRALPDYRWAWEFLRRNPEYRRDWSAALARYLSKTDEFMEWKGFGEALARGVHTIRFTGSSWPADPDDPEFWLPVDEAVKWSLRIGLLNPATDRPGNLAFQLGFGGFHFFKEGAEVLPKPAGIRYAWAVFDIQSPLKAQIELAFERMRYFQKERGIKPRRVKHHRKLWPLYLRLLDADLDERTPKQIANVLDRESASSGLDEKKVWNQLRAARAMTQPNGYLSIFLSPEPRQKVRPSE